MSAGLIWSCGVQVLFVLKESKICSLETRPCADIMRLSCFVPFFRSLNINILTHRNLGPRKSITMKSHVLHREESNMLCVLEKTATNKQVKSLRKHFLCFVLKIIAHCSICGTSNSLIFVVVLQKSLLQSLKHPQRTEKTF